MTVNIFTSGDHKHAGVDGAFPNGGVSEAEDILEIFLEKAGYKDFRWEVRVDTMQHCSSESRLIRMVNYKPFGVTLKVKPFPNATSCQIMTLQIPDGSGIIPSVLFQKLKSFEKTISRQWRKEKRKFALEVYF